MCIFSNLNFSCTSSWIFKHSPKKISNWLSCSLMSSYSLSRHPKNSCFVSQHRHRKQCFLTRICIFRTRRLEDANCQGGQPTDWVLPSQKILGCARTGKRTLGSPIWWDKYLGSWTCNNAFLLQPKIPVCGSMDSKQDKKRSYLTKSNTRSTSTPMRSDQKWFHPTNFAIHKHGYWVVIDKVIESLLSR